MTFSKVAYLNSKPKLGPITVGIGILGGFRDENLILTCPLFLCSLVPVISLFESASVWLK